MCERSSRANARESHPLTHLKRALVRDLVERAKSSFGVERLNRSNAADGFFGERSGFANAARRLELVNYDRKTGEHVLVETCALRLGDDGLHETASEGDGRNDGKDDD